MTRGDLIQSVRVRLNDEAGVVLTGPALRTEVNFVLQDFTGRTGMLTRWASASVPAGTQAVRLPTLWCCWVICSGIADGDVLSIDGTDVEAGTHYQVGPTDALTAQALARAVDTLCSGVTATAIGSSVIVEATASNVLHTASSNAPARMAVVESSMPCAELREVMDSELGALRAVSHRTLRAAWSASGAPAFYALSGLEQIVLHPTPSSARTLNILANFLHPFVPETAEADSAALLVPDRWQAVVLDGVCARAALLDAENAASVSRAKYYQDAYELGVRRAAGAVEDTGYSGALPVSLAGGLLPTSYPLE